MFHFIFLTLRYCNNKLDENLTVFLVVILLFSPKKLFPSHNPRISESSRKNANKSDDPSEENR